MFITLLNGSIFIRFLLLGLKFGLIFEIFKLIKRISKNNLVIVNTVLFVWVCALGTAYCVNIVNICSGEIKLFTMLATVVGVLIEQICIGFFFTKFYNLVYNVFIKVTTKLKNTHLGSKILR